MTFDFCSLVFAGISLCCVGCHCLRYRSIAVLTQTWPLEQRVAQTQQTLHVCVRVLHLYASIERDNDFFIVTLHKAQMPDEVDGKKLGKKRHI